LLPFVSVVSGFFLDATFQELGVRSATRIYSADGSALTAWLEQQLAAPVSVVVTDNRSSLVSVKHRSACGYHLRVHHMFCQAPKSVWRALAAYVRGSEGTARQVLDAYIEAQQHLIRPPAPRRLPRLYPDGRFFNLEQIYQDLNRTYFDARVVADITWGRRSPHRPRRSIRFGSYDANQRLIRIHHLLDRSFVPQYFVESVVFHEMLHQLIPRQRINGRWSVHPPAFRQAEQRFPSYEQALQWQQRHLARLLQG
jgi:hypothetical protein